MLISYYRYWPLFYHKSPKTRKNNLTIIKQRRTDAALLFREDFLPRSEFVRNLRTYDFNVKTKRIHPSITLKK